MAFKIATPTTVTKIPVNAAMNADLIFLVSHHTVTPTMIVKINPKKIDAIGFVGVSQSYQDKKSISLTPL
jgi:hypothetical protein